MPNFPEQFPSRTPERSEDVEPTEDVLARLDNLAERYREHHPGTPEERAQARVILHTTLDKFENHEMKESYDEGRLPTFRSLERAASLISSALIDSGEAEATTLAKLLEGSTLHIKSWSRKYVASILRFRRASMARARMSDEEVRDSYIQADRDRRRIHDALLESLSAVTRLIEQAKDYIEPIVVKKWRPGDRLPKGTADSEPVVFSSEAVANRDLIRDWAIVADRIEEINKITKHE